MNTKQTISKEELIKRMNERERDQYPQNVRNDWSLAREIANLFPNQDYSDSNVRNLNK